MGCKVHRREQSQIALQQLHMVTDGNHSDYGDHFVMYRNIESL